MNYNKNILYCSAVIDCDGINKGNGKMLNTKYKFIAKFALSSTIPVIIFLYVFAVIADKTPAFDTKDLICISSGIFIGNIIGAYIFWIKSESKK